MLSVWPPTRIFTDKTTGGHSGCQGLRLLRVNVEEGGAEKSAEDAETI